MRNSGLLFLIGLIIFLIIKIGLYIIIAGVVIGLVWFIVSIVKADNQVTERNNSPIIKKPDYKYDITTNRECPQAKGIIPNNTPTDRNSPYAIVTTPSQPQFNILHSFLKQLLNASPDITTLQSIKRIQKYEQNIYRIPISNVPLFDNIINLATETIQTTKDSNHKKRIVSECQTAISIIKQLQEGVPNDLIIEGLRPKKDIPPIIDNSQASSQTISTRTLPETNEVDSSTVWVKNKNEHKLDLITAFTKQLLNSTSDRVYVNVVDRVLKYQESFHCSTWSKDDLFRHITGITNNMIKISRHSAEKRETVKECVIINSIIELLESNTPFDIIIEKIKQEERNIASIANNEIPEEIPANYLGADIPTGLVTSLSDKYKNIEDAIKLINEGIIYEKAGNFTTAVICYKNAALKAVDGESYLNYHKAQQRLVELYEKQFDKEGEQIIINETIAKLSEVGHPLKYWKERLALYNDMVSFNKISEVQSEKPSDGISEIIDSLLTSRHSLSDIGSLNNGPINTQIDSNIDVPNWSHFYVYSADDLHKANKQQTEFYNFFKEEFIKGNYIDIGDNHNYAFILMFDLIEDYKEHQNLEKVQMQLAILGEKYPRTARYTKSALNKSATSNIGNQQVHNIQINISHINKTPEKPKERLFQKCKWIAAGKVVDLHGYKLERGNFYLGEKFLLPKNHRSYWGDSSNPFILTSVINPKLPISSSETVLERFPAYRFSSYTDMTPYLREQHIQWLSGEISVDEVSFDILFHYLYGLELRMFIDKDTTNGERSQILRSVIELRDPILERGGVHNYGIRSYFNDFIDSAITKFFPTTPLDYVSEDELCEYTIYAHYILQQSIGDKVAISCDFAYSLAVNIFDLSKVVPSKYSNYIKNRFDYYFKSQHPRGLRISQKDYYSSHRYTVGNKNVSTQAFSPEQRYISCDIFEATHDLWAVTNALKDPYWNIRREFSSYNRFIEEQRGKETLPALFALPKYVNINEEEKIIEFNAFLDNITQYNDYKEVDIDNILNKWEHSRKSEKTLHKKYVDSILTAFDRLGYGLVPDYRIDKKRFNYGDQGIVFYKGTSDAFSMNNSYARMEIFIKLSAYIIQADGNATNQENDFVHKYIHKQIDQEVNRKYLIGYYEWYKLNKQKIDSKLKNVISSLFFENEKQETIDALIGLCCANGDVSTKKTEVIKKLIEFFGMDNSNIHSRIHRTFTGEIDNFITIEKQSDATEFSIPSKSEVKPKFYIDIKKLNKIEQDTKESQSMLKEIFSTEDTVPAFTMPINQTSFNLEILRFLFAKDYWDRKDVEDICREHNLMLGSVLEKLNDYSYSKVDDAVIEDEGDRIYVNTAYKEQLI